MSIAASDHDPRSIGQRELVVLVALLMSLNAFSIDGMLPSLAAIATELGAAEGNQRQLVVSVFLLANGVGCLLPGVLADRFGRRPLLLLAVTANFLFCLLVSEVRSFTLLLVLRALQGLFGAGLAVVPMAIIRDRYEGDQMARLFSLISAVFITVPVFAPSLGQAILLFAGWRWIFVILAGLGSLAVAWTYLRLPESLHPEYRQDIHVPTILHNMRVTLFHRGSVLQALVLHSLELAADQAVVLDRGGVELCERAVRAAADGLMVRIRNRLHGQRLCRAVGEASAEEHSGRNQP